MFHDGSLSLHTRSLKYGKVRFSVVWYGMADNTILFWLWL